ncbi:hypothetical protein V1511DRAFT_22326 [Dipodascopsis uninucleata]
MQQNNNRGTQDTITVLKTFLFSRFNAANKLLDLQGMYTDPFLQQNGLFATPTTTSKMFPALMKIAAMEQQLRDVESVNLAANQLQDVAAVTTLAQTYPNLKNLSLANNMISQWRNLDPWRHKFRELRELILVGNPIASSNNYRSEIIRRFPSLKMLDGQVIEGLNMPDPFRSGGKAPNTFAANIKKLPVATKQSFFETEEVQRIVMEFLGTFFNVYDSDRSQLMPVYDNLSLFSISVNTNAPREQQPGHAVQNWSAYIPLSRNLTRITATNGRVNRLAVGQSQIMELLRKIPASKHDLMSPEKFAIDAWTRRDLRSEGDTGLFVIIHGEFEEAMVNPRPGMQPMKRSFDRSLLLLPDMSNGRILVVSDMLTVRPWAGTRAWIPRQSRGSMVR